MNRALSGRVPRQSLKGNNDATWNARKDAGHRLGKRWISAGTL